MATLSTAAKDAALQAIVNLMNVGTLFAGPLFNVVSTVPAIMFQNAIDVAPAFTVSGGVASLINAPRDLTLTAGGTVRATSGIALLNRAASVAIFIFRVGTVGSGEDIEMLTTTAVAGQKLRVSAFDITIG
jgi:hypothetical protein